LEIILDKAQPERLLRFYFGAYVGEDGGDPFASGMLIEKASRFYVFPDRIEAQYPGWGTKLQHIAVDRVLDWEELTAFLYETYYVARKVPPTLEKFREIWPYYEVSWIHFEVNGPMTTARRKIYVAEKALQSVLLQYSAQGSRLMYPVGTAIVGEHHTETTHLETTAMIRRGDGFWDFVTYGTDGYLSLKTSASPRSFTTPTQCVGCHFGSKLFEPERSFPAPALPGPDGIRTYYVEDDMRDAVVMDFFDEHRKRSDMILGLYNTMYVSKLRADRQRGILSEEGERILDALGL